MWIWKLPLVIFYYSLYIPRQVVETYLNELKEILGEDDYNKFTIVIINDNLKQESNKQIIYI